ncbi:FtsX-like permease family protein [Candidatus Saccharibacteria bacterium]|nr:FtsX-like permease family protein [Candidatus Saccharibacteria bacterium]
MFKNMLKRSWLSVKRKPGRSIIIGLILFAMSNLILAAIVIKSAVNEQMEYAKESLGGTVTIQADMEKLREEMGDPSSKSFEELKSSSSSAPAKFERPSVTKSVADKIAQSDYVKDYTYSISSSANDDALTAIETSGGNFGGGFGGRMGGPEAEENSGDFTISGINSYAFIQQVKNGSMSISSGEYFDEDDTDKCIISVDLAEENNLSVGDTITMTNINNNAAVTLTIMGIYDVSENMFNANTIYMNVDTAAKFISSDDYNNGDYKVENVSYELKNAENAEAFISWINAEFPELAEKNLTASEDTREYDQMVGPIESVGSFATTILIIVIVAAAVIITLIVMINVKDRRYEIGVLTSLGAKKLNIIGQIFLELVMVGTVAFALSTATSTVLAKTMGQGILDSQIASSSEASEKNFGRPSGGPGGSFKPGAMGGSSSSTDDAPEMSGASNSSRKENENVISEINISAKPSDFALLFASGYGVILVALLLPAISILRYSPKKILQGKE